jgi:hypothetical protein
MQQRLVLGADTLRRVAAAIGSTLFLSQGRSRPVQ